MSKYDDILFLPHYQSKTRPHMTNLQRAAQFSAFAALKGFDEEIAETARYTEEGLTLSEERKTELGGTLATLKKGRKLSVTYFLPDPKKTGGSYVTRDGILKNIDVIGEFLTFLDGETVPFDAISELIVLA